MRTIKQVWELTGISVRMLHHYDKIGLLNPTATTEAGYRLYCDEALETLQQILFFKELGVPLKTIKEILSSPHYDKVQALRKQKELLSLKRDRLNELLALLERKLEGGGTMSFKEFDLSEYISVLETYKQEHTEEMNRYFGGSDAFDRVMELAKANEIRVAKLAIKEFGSIEKYTNAIRNNLDHLPAIMEGFETIKTNAEASLAQSNQLMERLTSDLNRDPTSPEAQAIVQEMDAMVQAQYETLQMERGENYWGFLADLYLTRPEYAAIHDKKYGQGASNYIGQAFRYFSESRH